jgi:hypothetical protein
LALKQTLQDAVIAVSTKARTFTHSAVVSIPTSYPEDRGFEYPPDNGIFEAFRSPSMKTLEYRIPKQTTKAFFCPMFPDTRKSIALFEISQASPDFSQ